jgi:hypothetical protein
MTRKMEVGVRVLKEEKVIELGKESNRRRKRKRNWASESESGIRIYITNRQIVRYLIVYLYITYLINYLYLSTYIYLSNCLPLDI